MAFLSSKKGCTILAIIASSFVVLLYSAGCSPPEYPIKCSTKNSNCTITNSYGAFPDRTTCRAADAVYPATEDELLAVVAAATKIGRKMKVATRYSHSFPKLVCLDGENGLLISTQNLNNIHNINITTGIVTIDSGVTLQQLINEAAKANLALPYAPYWWGLTIGGMLSTGAHGSSLWAKGSAVHDYLLDLRIVSPGQPKEGYVKLRIVNKTSADFDAVKVSLGVLGVISQVSLKLEPMFKRSITYKIERDSNIGDQALTFGNDHEFADLTWFPSRGEVMYRFDDRVPVSTKGNGLYNFIGFRPTLSTALAITRSLEENQESRRDVEGKCTVSDLITKLLRTQAYGLKNNGIIFNGYPVIGYQNRMQSSGTCLDSLEDALITTCPWDSRVKGEFFHQTGISISMPKVKAFIEDVQKLVSLEPKSLCGLNFYNGILMSAYLGKEEDGIEFDITYYRSTDPLTPRLFEDILEEIEQMAVFKYGGLPHWGKNRNLVFEGTIKKYKHGNEFVKFKERFDPQGLFSSEWTDQVLGLKEGLSIIKEGCALEGLCVCSQDSHCASNMGYFCKPGRIYKDARVATRYSHSFPKLVCLDGENGLLISTQNLNNIHNINITTGIVTIDSGVTLQQLINEAAKANLALPYAPYWWGLTIGGMLSTGAHGSSLWAKGSAVHDYLLDLRIVSPGQPKEGYVKLRIVNKTSADFDAVKVSLGVLGVISQVSLKLEPMFKRSITYKIERDSNIGDQALTFGDDHEFADLTWFPNRGEVMYRFDDRVPVSTKGNGLYNFIGFRPTLSTALAITRSLEENQESRRDVEGKCTVSDLITKLLRTQAYGLTNNGIIFNGYPVIGYQNRMQSSGTCLDSLEDALITTCPWDSRVKGEFFHQTGISISMPKVKAFIEDVQKLVSLEPKSLCGLNFYNGILMRYVKASSAYLGKEEDGIEFDITYYRSTDPLTPRLFEDILEEIEQMAVFKYGGLPHWGKNRNLAFEGTIKKYKHGNEFVKFKERFDPQELFSSEWTDQVLGLKEGLSIIKEGCALEGLCVCSQDSHCAPNKGYFCKPGRIYKDARVCTSTNV